MSPFDPRAVLDATLECTVVGSFTRIGFALRRRIFEWDTANPADLTGRVVVVTGATGGLGLAAAHMLAHRGATLCLLGRDRERLDEARRSIGELSPGTQVDVAVADLALLEDVRDAGRTIASEFPAVHALVHNAGVLVHELRRSADDNELTAQVHVVAPFLLTTLLRPCLRRAGDGRVITITSGGMYARALDVGALAEPDAPFRGARVYANAKRAQVVLTDRWARHAAGAGIRFHAMHPGWVDTPGLQQALPTFRRVMRPVLRSPEQGADTAVWLTGEPAALDSNGELWFDRRRRTTVRVPGTRTADADAARLWDWCVERSGVNTTLGAGA